MTACLEPNPNLDGETDTGSDAGTEAAGTDTGDTDSETSSVGSSSETGSEEASPPRILSFRVNGSAQPDTVEAAGSLLLNVEAGDLDGDLDSVEFRVDGQSIGSVGGAGPGFQLEWVVSGAALNGVRVLEVIAYDGGGLSSAPVQLSLTLAMPEGGVVAETWNYDGGLLESVYDVAVSPDGDEVLLVGQTIAMNVSSQRVDRVVGAVWGNKNIAESVAGSGAEWAEGAFIVAGSNISNQAIDSAVFAFDSGGSIADLWSVHAAKPELGLPEVIDLSNGMARAEDGRIYVIGTYVPTSGPFVDQRASYLMALTATGELDWLRWPTEDTLNFEAAPIITEIAVSPSGAELAVVGYRQEGDQALWLTRWTLNGDLLSEYVVDGVDPTQGHGLAYADSEALVVTGGRRQDLELESWARMLNADNETLWTVEPVHAGRGVTAGVAVDAWGRVVTVSTEGCDEDFLDCDLAVRKYAPDGSPMWTVAWTEETFTGPVPNLPGSDASVVLDRFGYVYVTGIAYTAGTGTDWWARKLHP